MPLTLQRLTFLRQILKAATLTSAHRGSAKQLINLQNVHPRCAFSANAGSHGPHPPNTGLFPPGLDVILLKSSSLCT